MKILILLFGISKSYLYDYNYEYIQKTRFDCNYEKFQTNVVEKVEKVFKKFEDSKRTDRWIRNFSNIFLTSLWRAQKADEILYPRIGKIKCIHRYGLPLSANIFGI